MGQVVGRLPDRSAHLSYQCHTRANSSFLFFTLEACWKALLHAKSNPKLAELTVAFLLRHHAAAKNPAADADQEEEAAEEGAVLMRHLCSRIVLFVASAERAAPMVAQLLAALPTHEPAAFAPPQKAQLLLDELMRVGGADDADTLDVAAQPSAFLLAAELVHAHHAQLTAQLPQLLVLATVTSDAPPSTSRCASAGDARPPPRRPHEPHRGGALAVEAAGDAAGRAALVAALGAGAGGAALTAAWGAACLAWAMGARDSRVRVAALEWYEAIVLASPDGLPYDDAHRVALLVAACQAQGEAAVVAAALNLLCSYATAAPAVPYATATLLACVAVPCLSSPLVKQFALSQSILRSLLERRLQPDELLLVTEEAAAAAPPMSVLPAAPDTSGWKSQLLLPALSAQIVAYGGAAPSADEVLRGPSSAAARSSSENTVWLLSALRGARAPTWTAPALARRCGRSCLRVHLAARARPGRRRRLRRLVARRARPRLRKPSELLLALHSSRAEARWPPSASRASRARRPTGGSRRSQRSCRSCARCSRPGRAAAPLRRAAAGVVPGAPALGGGGR